MRSFACVLALLPLPLAAETFTLPSQATQAGLFAEGGIVTHEVTISVPAGHHRFRFPDLPPDLDLEQLLIDGAGLDVAAMRFREDVAPPRPEPERPEVTAAREKLEAIDLQLRSTEDAARAEELAAEAAEARIAFLADLGNSEALPEDVTKLAEIAEMISSQTLAAKQAAHKATLAARDQRDKLKDLFEDRRVAQAELDALVPEREERPLLVLDVHAKEDLINSPLRISYLSEQVAWEPTYRLHLDWDGKPTVRIERGANVRQGTGENWTDVQLSLSTQQIGQTDPRRVYPDLRRVFEPQPPSPKVMMRADDGNFGSLAEPVIEAPVMTEEAESQFTGYGTQSQGLALTYNFPQPVDLASEADAAQLALDVLEFEAEIFARAAPLGDDTAYVMARFTNTSEDPLLPSWNAMRFFDGGLVGGGNLDAIAPGEEIELGFGPIMGLQIDRTVLRRNEGDRGFISRSNESSESVRIDVTNLTERTWPIELIDRVPYSEQEELEITYSATPQPDIDDLDDDRGILQWNLTLEPDETTQITTRYQMTWPEGKIVQ